MGRMEQIFKLILYTKRQVSDVETARVLWRLLDDPLVAPHRFDSVERAKIPFRHDAAEDAARLYEDDRMLFVKGRKDKFNAMFKPQPGGPAKWYFGLDLKVMEGEKAERWLEWFFRLCGELPVLYGLGCSVAEYETKHQRVRTYPDGSTSTGAVGISTAEFWQYLPGLYWLTIFGAELVRTFGAARLESLPGVKVYESSAGQMGIRIDEPVVPADMNRRLEKETQLADALGAQYFFDRNRTGVQFQPVPALLEALNRKED